jgi:hypothetical protein
MVDAVERLEKTVVPRSTVVVTGGGPRSGASPCD